MHSTQPIHCRKEHSMYPHNTRTQIVAWLAAIAVVASASGCTQQKALTTPTSTVPAPTLVAFTATPLPTVAEPTSTPTALPTVTPTPTPDLAATATACKPAAQVIDVTVPDGSRFKPGETFVKTWRFASSGNCAWEKGSTLAFQNGEKFGAPDAAPLDAVDVGKSAEISLTLKAPQKAGAYQGQWALQRPSGQVVVTTTVRINVFAPTPKPIVAVAPTSKPAASTVGGSIPPVGSGPFEADANASGPWNCVGFKNDQDWFATWAGDFYIGVRGGPGNYTINDSNCRWDYNEKKFVCHYSTAMGAYIERALLVSCPGCTPQQVALHGRGITDKNTKAGECQVQNIVAVAPTTAPTANITSTVSLVGGPLVVDSSATGPYNCALVGENDWQGDFFIGVRGGPGTYTIDDTEHCQWNAERHGFVCRYIWRLGAYITRRLTVTCPGCTRPGWTALAGKGVKSEPPGWVSAPGTCVAK
jgi:hypothetical protein